MSETPVPAAARVPTELWDIIMRIAQDPPGRRPYFPLLRLKNWKSYSLVCRHWRYVALPYIFRRLRIHSKGPALEDYPQLLADAPCEIAEVIQEVVIEHPLNIDITQLDALLGCLPRIQVLHLQCNIQRRKRGTERVYRNYILKQLRWAYQPARMIGLPRAWLFESFLDLLALFTEIEALSFASDGYGEDPGQQLIDGPIPEAPISPDIRQVRSLSFECARFILSCLPPILSNSYDLRTLKSLTVHMTRPNMLLLLNKLLHLIGPTLRSFELQLNAMDEFISNFRPLLEDIRSGLAACSSLEEFSVSAPLQQDLTRSWRNINHVWHANSWPLVGSATGLVNFSRLSRLRMVIHCTNDRSTAEHVHGLPWSGIRDACKRFPNLRFLHVGVKIEETYYDQRFFNHSLCVKYEMQEFRRILILDEEDTRLPLAQCSNSDCKRFNEAA